RPRLGLSDRPAPPSARVGAHHRAAPRAPPEFHAPSADRRQNRRPRRSTSRTAPLDCSPVFPSPAKLPMDIVVCIKRVPATDTTIKIAADGRSIDPTGVTFELNAYDEFALEQALRIKEQLGTGTVTVVTIGSKDAQKE